jgi:glutaredoxin
MDKTDSSKGKTTLLQGAATKVVGALNRADEIGGEVRDWVQERVLVDPRYVAARKRVAKLLGKDYVSRNEETAKAANAESKRAAAAPVAGPKVVRKGLGDAGVKAQIYGKKSCAWSGRVITLFEKQKVDYDFIDMDEPENEKFHLELIAETHQNTVPYVYLRGQFVGGYNAVAEIERLGQLEFALMTQAERDALPEHQRSVVIVPRPDKDEVAPAEAAERTAAE